MLRLRKIFTDRRGVTSIEYALIASLISVAAIASYGALGDQVENSFETTSEKMAGK